MLNFIILGLYYLFNDLTSLLKWLYRYTEWIGLGCFIGLVGTTLIPARIMDIRPFTYVPWGAHNWEYLVFGLTTGILCFLWINFLIGGLFILPVLVPIKIIFYYVLGPGASILFAVIALPVTAFASSIFFYSSLCSYYKV